MSFYQTATLLPHQFSLVLASFLQKAGLPFADLLSEEQIQQAFDDEDASFAEGEDDISWRGLVNKRCCLGRRRAVAPQGADRPRIPGAPRHPDHRRGRQESPTGIAKAQDSSLITAVDRAVVSETHRG